MFDLQIWSNNTKRWCRRSIVNWKQNIEAAARKIAAQTHRFATDLRVSPVGRREDSCCSRILPV